ncbi:MAG: hypothetical protein IJ614_07440 [Prevotella sp.]|nr:hypothetical protein [Prevotella sp.]
MNLRLHIIIWMLGMMTLMPSICFARSSADSLLLHRIWDYYGNYAQDLEGTEQNVYMVYSFKTERRNPLLFLVPTMYSIAKGNREFAGEAYCKLKYQKGNKYDLTRQVICGTIPRNRKVMPAMLEFMTPNVYDISLYPDRLLSPFHYDNRHYYKYSISHIGGELSKVVFRPRLKNTQLVSGHAVVNTNSGRIQSIVYEGEFDMIKFNVTALMNLQHPNLALPERSTTTATFKFLGNHINTTFTAYYNCPTTLPDSIVESTDMNLMEQLRPTPLQKEEHDIYEQYKQQQQEAAADTTKPSKFFLLKEKAWDLIGDNLINTQRTHAGPLSAYMSPLFNPLYFAYSRSHGVAYRLNAGLQYNWNAHRYLTISPHIGYNFKLRQFYYYVPLRMTYNPKRNGFAEVIWGNGNRTSNETMVDDIIKKVGPDVDIPVFKDEFLQAYNNVVAFDWLEIMSGIVYHRRKSFNPTFMRSIGMPEEYRSFAPMLTLHFTPWRKGPVLTVNYERSFKNILKSNLNYERWELDASYKQKVKKLRVMSLRGGLGFYTHRSTDYFVDYNNFRDENLPTGWEDEWTGQFQMLNSQWYNESDYYLRCHFTYDSPLLALSWIPHVGRIIETERIYLSGLSIAHKRPYFEVGYGFTNRFFSTGIFGSILGTEFYQFGFKLTLHVFSRW